jgi:hypothetical protein
VTVPPEDDKATAYTFRELAEFLDCDPATIWKFAARGQLRAERRAGIHVVEAAEARRFLTQGPAG